MRKTYLDDLPRKKSKKNKILINWKKAIGYKINFVYDNIKGSFIIVNYYTNNNKTYLKIRYNDEEYDIRTDYVLSCNIQKTILDNNFKCKYNIGDIITTTNNNKIKILNVTREKQNKRGYEYKCLNCGNIDIITEYALINNAGCTVCNHRKVLKGYNDMWTTNPNLAKLLYNPEDGYKYSDGSHEKVDWKCPDCGNIVKNKEIHNIKRQGLSCPKCNDKFSYPEKFIYNILKQLNMNFICQLAKNKFKWINKYRYDFYFEFDNEGYIIEANGLQHYEYTGRGRSLEEEKENDKIKKELALTNNIKEENYIIIDCRYSELEFIKNNILHSRLDEIFDLSKIDWIKCHEFACSSRVKEICDYWNNGIHNTKEIANKTYLNRGTIIKYLKQGAKLGWCNYNPTEEITKSAKRFGKNGKYVEVIKDGKSLGIFFSCMELKRQSKELFGIEFCDSGINRACKLHKTYKGFTFKYIKQNK